MTELRFGTLLYKGPGTGYDAWGRLAVDDGTGHHPITNPRRMLVPELREKSGEQLHGLGVEFDWDGQRVGKVRRRTTTPLTSAAPKAPAAGATQPGADRGGPRRRGRYEIATGHRTIPDPDDSFHNPYAFVPALARGTATVPGQPLGLGDSEPAGHDAHLTDLWSGRIGVTMRVVTPLLVLDTADPVELADDHFVYHPLTRDGRPYLPPTSVKGMLRAAYEAVTNSRLGVFVDHDRPLERPASASPGGRRGRAANRGRPAPRERFDKAPADLLDPSLHPAENLRELSPADRVFGWAHPAGHGAYRGQLRVCPIDPSGAEIETFAGADGHGFPLAILGAPKTTQGRFYAGAGSPTAPVPYDDGTTAEQLYTAGSTLRGRKVYPHHAGLPEGHWADPLEDRTQRRVGRRYQEYRRPDASDETKAGNAQGREGAQRDGRTLLAEPQRDSQNRSVTGWIRVGSVFRFTLEVRNLSDVELGALLWLLTLPPEHVHRLGLGKPLGFGSVRLDLDDAATVLRTGTVWRKYHATFADRLPGANPEVNALVAAFEQASDACWPDRPHLNAFLATAKGDPTIPVHYPRVRLRGQTGPVPPDPAGRQFAWFTANERGPKLSLPATGEKPLRILSDPQTSRGARGSGQPQPRR